MLLLHIVQLLNKYEPLLFRHQGVVMLDEIVVGKYVVVCYNSLGRTLGTINC